MNKHKALYCVTFLLAIALISPMTKACVAVYTDSNVDTAQNEVQAWSFVEDYYNSGSCFQQFANPNPQGPSYWEHTYEASVYIESPTYNSVFDDDEQANVPYGGGSAFADATISYAYDYGTYTLNWVIRIWCTIAGEFVELDLTDIVVVTPGCTGEPAVMAGEYLPGGAYTLGVIPAIPCEDFEYHASNHPILPNFTWGELNDDWTGGGNPHPGWSHLKSGPLYKLQATRNVFGSIIVAGGYRSPIGNQAVGGVTNSYHMQGRSFDLFGSSKNWTEEEFEDLRMVAEAQGTTESLNYGFYTDHHYHVTFY